MSLFIPFLLFLCLSLLPCRAISQYTAFEASLIDQACMNSRNLSSCHAHVHAEFTPHGRPVSVLHGAVRGTVSESIRAIDEISGILHASTTFRERTAVRDCMELLEYTVHELAMSLAEMGRGDGNNIRSWLSAALTNQDTCMEGFEGTDGRIRSRVQGSLDEVNQLVGNVMALHEMLYGVMGGGRVDNSEEEEEMMMEAAAAEGMTVDAVVALDGTGRYRTVGEAVRDAPEHMKRRYVIHVKKGVYKENVEVKKKKTNIMLVGDGMGSTVITGNRSFMQGWTTFRTATFAVAGEGFIARDMTFRNTAGPENHQAVALRVDSDRSAFYRCSIEGYQDTLYAHSLRQFYRDCTIHGTVDIIFGNGQAVLQNCNIFARTPLPYQKITVTAQGRKTPRQSTGFSIHRSSVHAPYPAYLGRPWRAYSRTVFMQCYLGEGVKPAGWLAWMGEFGLRTLYYGEYENYGPGSGLAGRVRWPGYHAIKDAAVARFFTVRRFIDGAAWLPATHVPFTPDLIK